METSEENSTSISTRSIITFAALGVVVLSICLIVWRKLISTKSNEKMTNHQNEWSWNNADADREINEFDEQ